MGNLPFQQQHGFLDEYYSQLVSVFDNVHFLNGMFPWLFVPEFHMVHSNILQLSSFMGMLS